MLRLVRAGIAVSAVWMLLSNPASAAVTTFEGAPNNGAPFQTYDGFTYQFLARGWGVFADSFAFTPPMTRNGTTRLMFSGLDQTELGSNGRVEISRTDGGLFSITGFDAASAFQGKAGSLTVTGVLGDLSTVSTSFDVDSTYDSYVLDTSFSGLRSITFAEATIAEFLDYGIGLDNIAFDLATPVPEPATWVLLIAGFGLIGGAMRRGRLLPVEQTPAR